MTAETTTLFLMRHAEVEERYQRIFGGRIDMELSPRGHDQALYLAGHMRAERPELIYASPMKRVQLTLLPLLIMAAAGDPPPVVLHGLREVDFGDWTGLSWEEVSAKFGVQPIQWLEQLELGAIPNAESGAEFRARVAPCLEQILREGAGRRVAVLCHGGTIRMMLSILLEQPLPKMASFEIDYASVTEVHCSPGRVEVQLMNFAPWRDAP
jgi:broad specificity phosphatase PhoE